MAEKENRGGGTVSLPSEEEEEEGREGPPKRRGVGRGGGGRLKGPELEPFYFLLPETNARKEDVQRLFNKLDFLSNNHHRSH